MSLILKFLHYVGLGFLCIFSSLQLLKGIKEIVLTYAGKQLGG